MQALGDLMEDVVEASILGDQHGGEGEELGDYLELAVLVMLGEHRKRASAPSGQ